MSAAKIKAVPKKASPATRGGVLITQRGGVLTAQFSTEAGLGSWLIRYLTAGEYSHVDIVISAELVLAALKRGWLPVGSPIPQTAEGLLGARSNGGVRLRPANYAKFTKVCRKQVFLPNIDAAYAYAFAQIGKPYATWRIADFFLHKFGNPAIFHPDRRGWFCDEYLYAVCQAAGVNLLGQVSPLNLTPQEVFLSNAWMK